MKKSRIVLLCSIIIVGALLAAWLMLRADREMREDLLTQTRLAAEAFSFHHLKELSGTAADLTSHAYLRLKSQLSTLKNSDQRIRFVYLMAVAGCYPVESQPLPLYGKPDLRCHRRPVCQA